MALELEGKVFQILPEQSGTSQKTGNNWRKQEFVIETEEQYPKKVVFNTWNDSVDAVKELKVGEKVRVYFRVQSREYNERWYTDLTAWRIVKIKEEAVEPPTTENTNTDKTPNDDIIYGDSQENQQEKDIPESEDDNSDINKEDLKKDKNDDDLPF